MSLYQTVTDQIVSELQSGTAPWVRPWAVSGVNEMPYNASSGRRYSGTNVLLLWLHSAAKGYSRPAYVTFNQARQAGGSVRKGEKSIGVIFTSTFEKGEGDDKRVVPFAKTTPVFNIDQCDGLPEAWYGKPVAKTPVEIDAAFTAFVAATGAKIGHGGDRAFYSTAEDRIQMPFAEAFTGANQYQATLLHELGHWTGHDARLNRTFGKRFGDKAYAAEELVAELTAAFLSAHLGITGELRHSGYIENWIELLKDDPKAIFTAAAAASKAADHIRGYSEPQEEAVAA
jgi:antirestriction protein ArdC